MLVGILVGCCRACAIVRRWWITIIGYKLIGSSSWMILGPTQILVFLSRLPCLSCHCRGAHANISTGPSRGRNTHHHQWWSHFFCPLPKQPLGINMLPHYCGFYRSKIFCSLASYQHNSRRNVLNVVVILLISDDCWKYSNDNHHEESFSPRLSTWDEPSLSAAIIRLVVLCTRAVNVIREISQLQEKVSNCLFSIVFQ